MGALRAGPGSVWGGTPPPPPPSSFCQARQASKSEQNALQCKETGLQIGPDSAWGLFCTGRMCLHSNAVCLHNNAVLSSEEYSGS